MIALDHLVFLAFFHVNAAHKIWFEVLRTFKICMYAGYSILHVTSLIQFCVLTCIHRQRKYFADT